MPRTRSTRRARSEAAAATFASILQPLVDSGHIVVKDVGILAQLSKEINQATMEESIWASFCQRHYPQTNGYTPRFREKKGYRWMYKRWSAPIVKYRPPPDSLGLPSCPAEKMYFHVHVRYGDASIVSLSKSADELLPFLLSKGSVAIEFCNPLILGKATWRSIQQRTVHCDDFDERKLITTVHVYSEVSKVISCIYSSRERRHDYYNHLITQPDVQEDEDVSHETKFDLSKEQQAGRLSYKAWRATRARLPLNCSSKAHQILRRFPHHVEFDVELKFKVVEGDKFAICDIDISASFLCPETQTLRLFDSDDEKAKSGVTLLHYLSELE